MQYAECVYQVKDAISIIVVVTIVLRMITMLPVTTIKSVLYFYVFSDRVLVKPKPKPFQSAKLPACHLQSRKN